MINLRNAAMGWGHGVIYKVLQMARHFQPIQNQSALISGGPIKEWGRPRDSLDIHGSFWNKGNRPLSLTSPTYVTTCERHCPWTELV